MWSAHSAIAKVKKQELELIKERLKTASHELKEQTAAGSIKGVYTMSVTVSV